MRYALTALPLLAVVLTGCAASAPPPELTQTQREDQFWTAYEQRLGLVGTDYADPVEAKQGSIEYGRFLCEELANGIDRDVLVSQGSGGTYTREEMIVQVDTATEFLCP